MRKRQRRQELQLYLPAEVNAMDLHFLKGQARSVPSHENVVCSEHLGGCGEGEGGRKGWFSLRVLLIQTILNSPLCHCPLFGPLCFVCFVSRHFYPCFHKEKRVLKQSKDKARL